MNPSTIEQPVLYKPLNERKPDTVQLNLMRKIMRRGELGYAPFQKQETRLLLMPTMRFNMANGFPLTPMRSLKKGFASAIGELIAFLNGARTLEDYVKYGGDRTWWEGTVTAEKCKTFGLEPGDFGKGSYGPSLTERMKNGEVFNQVEMMMQQLLDYPGVRTHALTTWIPEYNLQTKASPREVVTAPCHGTFVHFFLFPERKELKVTHLQRSGDVPVGVTFNIMQYAALGMMVAHIIGYKFTEYVHTISDAHIYECQYPFVKELLERKPLPLPTVTINTEVKNIFDFRVEHFTVEDYTAHPKMFIPTPF